MVHLAGAGDQFLLRDGFCPYEYRSQDSLEPDDHAHPFGLEPKKDGPQPLVQIEHDQGDVDDAFARVRELGHDPVQRAFALEVAKLAFHRNAVDLVFAFFGS